MCAPTRPWGRIIWCRPLAWVVIVHVHISKMAGTTIMRSFPKMAGIEYCPWQAERWPRHPTYGNASYFYELLAHHCAEHVGPACFSTYEGAWDDVRASCSQPPLMLTMLRNPVAWMFSAIR